jgi:hypothetical protein
MRPAGFVGLRRLNLLCVGLRRFMGDRRRIKKRKCYKNQLMNIRERPALIGPFPPQACGGKGEGTTQEGQVAKIDQQKPETAAELNGLVRFVPHCTALRAVSEK